MSPFRFPSAVRSIFTEHNSVGQLQEIVVRPDVEFAGIVHKAFHCQIFNEENESKNFLADHLIFRCVLLAGINAGPWLEGERKRLVNLFVVRPEASKGGIWLPTIL